VMKNNKVDIAVVQEVRWVGNGVLERRNVCFIIAVIQRSTSLVLDSMWVRGLAIRFWTLSS
jgi:hypothetical protein